MTQPAADVRTAAADIIEPHIAGTFKRRQRAESNAETLAHAGLLAGGNSRSALPVREQVANVLQCTNDWPTAEKITAELEAAGLLKGQ